MKNIIITGASGFVGQNLSKYLKDNNLVVQELSLRTQDWQSKKLQAQALIHLAGKAHDTNNTTDDSQYYQINTELTKKLFTSFLKSEVTDFFYFSSVKAVADTLQDTLYENAVPEPLTPYGKSKQEAEKFLLAQNLPAGKRLFIIRPCMIHGPGNKGNLNLLYQVVKKGVPYPLAAFNNNRSFLSIYNLNYLIKQIIDQPTVPSGIYNFSDDQPVSTNALVKQIAKSLNKKPKLWHINPKIIKALARLGDIIKLPLNSERLKKLTENYVVSNQKIKQALEIQNLPVSAQQGLETTIKSFL